MLKFDILQDEGLQEVLNKFISSLLPHSNYDAGMYSTVLGTVFKYIHLKEMNMEYYVMFELFDKLNNLRTSFGEEFSPNLQRDSVVSYLEVSITSLVMKYNVRITDWLISEGINSNLNNEETRTKACQKLANRCLQLYDDCFNMAEPTNTILNQEPVLKTAVLTHCSTLCVNMQKNILAESAMVGKKTYSAAEGWLNYTAMSLAEIQQRINDADSDKVVSISSLMSSVNLLDDLKSSYIPIAKYRIPEIDGNDKVKGTPILRHRLVVVVGKENIGKTKFAIDQAVNVLLEKKKVLFMCGETNKAKIYCDIIVNYVWKKTKYKAKVEHILGTIDPGEVLGAAIKSAILEISQNDLLILADAFDYGMVYTQLQSIYDEHKYDAVFIDHSCALVGRAGDGSEKANVDALASAVRRFRKDYPVYIMVTSHPSTTAKDSDSKNKITVNSPTRGSQNLSTDADEVFYIRDNEDTRKRNIVLLENTKRRDAARLTDYVKLRKDFAVSAFIYEASDQISDANAVTSEAGKSELINAITKINQTYGESEDEDFDLGDNFDETVQAIAKASQGTPGSTAETIDAAGTTAETTDDPIVQQILASANADLDSEFDDVDVTDSEFDDVDVSDTSTTSNAEKDLEEIMGLL